jgi:MFS family permease
VLEEEKGKVLRNLWQAAKDYRTWIFACLQMSASASISYGHFVPTLLKDLGFKSNTTTLLLTSPPYVLGFLYALPTCWYADKLQTRSPSAGFAAMLALIGGIMAFTLPQNDLWPRYGAMFLLVYGTYGISCTTYTWLSSTIPKPPAKRAASIGMANSLANVASFYGNYFWLHKYEPDYTEFWSVIIAFLTLCSMCILALRLLLSRGNRRFEELDAQHGAGELDARRLTEEEERVVHRGF